MVCESDCHLHIFEYIIDDKTFTENDTCHHTSDLFFFPPLFVFYMDRAGICKTEVPKVGGGHAPKRGMQYYYQ